MKSKQYEIWIEVEHLAEDERNIYDDNTDVIVTFNDNKKWIASFFTYRNIGTLVQKNKQTGENINGKYFWSSDMLLVDEISRKRIEEIIEFLLNENEFKEIFREFR